MPPRDPELPEGTDQIVTESATQGSATDGGAKGGFVAKGGGSAQGSGVTTDKLVSLVRDEVSNLRGQATERLRGFADDGKGRATDLLDDIAEVIEDAARSIEERLGGEYAGYARSASGAVSGFSERVRDKSVDDILDDTRDFVRKSPGVAIAAAAVIGFALMRVVRTGLDQASGGSGDSGRGRSRRSANNDTTTSGGA